MSTQLVTLDLAGPQQALHALRNALNDASSVPYLAMSRSELATHVVELQELAAQMDAVMAEATAAAHDVAVHLIDGLLSLPAFVAAHTNTEPKRVAGDRNPGSWLLAFPVFADAFRAGRITRQHIQVPNSPENSRTCRSLLDVQEYLTDAAANAPWRDFCEVLHT